MRIALPLFVLTLCASTATAAVVIPGGDARAAGLIAEHLGPVDVREWVGHATFQDEKVTTRATWTFAIEMANNSTQQVALFIFVNSSDPNVSFSHAILNSTGHYLAEGWFVATTDTTILSPNSPPAWPVIIQEDLKIDGSAPRDAPVLGILELHDTTALGRVIASATVSHVLHVARSNAPILALVPTLTIVTIAAACRPRRS